jgi:hypothetical protein
MATILLCASSNAIPAGTDIRNSGIAANAAGAAEVLMFLIGCPQTLPLGMITCTFASVTTSVQNRDSAFTVPLLPPIVTELPIRNGRKINSMTPAAKLESVPCNASPIASDAAPMTATKLVV